MTKIMMIGAIALTAIATSIGAVKAPVSTYKQKPAVQASSCCGMTDCCTNGCCGMSCCTK